MVRDVSGLIQLAKYKVVETTFTLVIASIVNLVANMITNKMFVNQLVVRQ